ncbi:cell division protein FtsQ [Chryseobacterium sp. RG1]|uniref:Cell division protein FtsQ n=1 Tax=Chryseobacterium tagetis TaxID=2801334 RepID=A0ABS7ZZQ9_9FLAO|nr:cell division protein FtsQ [Chryseobacterium tagetis]MCA6067226.1 cell division protein FtsQ [Chryseobacterium tagetis]
MKNKYRILKIAITVIILGFLLSFSLRKFSGQKITDDKISVKMSNGKTLVYFIDEKDIREIVKKENPSGKVGDLNIPALEKKINNLPAVDSANVYLNLNGKLNLDIKQRVPIFRLNKDGRDFYVDEKGTEFPISKTYSHPCMLVTGDVQKDEYQQLAELVEKIDKDDFSKKYFIGISKDRKGNYNLLTSEGNYKVEIGDLDNIEFKVKGFKAFVEKYLVYQDPQKYNKVSVKYQNQIVTTLNPYFKENDSILNVGNKELAKASTTPPAVRKTVEVLPKAATVKKPSSTSSKPKAPTKPKETKKTEKKATATKPKAKIKIE